MGGKASNRADAAAGEIAVVETGAGTTDAVHDEVRAIDGARVEAEGTSTGAVGAAEALAAGGAGAGVGGQRIVEATGDPALRDVPLVGADHVGDRTGTFARPPADRRDAFGSYLDDVIAGRRVGTFDVAGVTMVRPGRNAILPLAAPKLDPRLVPGTKVATAAAQVLQGRGYAPGEKVPVDFKTHAELTAAGAIVAEAWHDLPDHEG